jgi:hypothetical protein
MRTLPTTPTDHAGERPAASRGRPGRAPGRLRTLAPFTAALVGLALLLAGCGGSSSPGVAHVGSSTTSSNGSGAPGGQSAAPESRASAQQKLVAFARCMRSHGEPEFPEPTEGNIEIHGGPKSSLNPESAQFQAAEKACKSLQPAGKAPSPAQAAQMQAQALKFSECMRSHGVPNFPDPTFSGHGASIRIKGGPGSGLDPNSPQFEAAQKACQSVSPLGKAPPGASTSSAGGPGGQSGSSGSVAVAP